MELVVLVDRDNRQIGAVPKEEIHSKKTPLHRGFSCYVFDKKGRFLLTQRAKSKKTFPGVWTNSCCGHPAPGETNEKAVRRRLQDELNLEVKKIELILPNFRYRAEMQGIVENEICPVFFAKTDEEPTLNPNEVEDYKWVDWKDFVENIEKNPAGYSSWSEEQVQKLKGNSKLKEYTG